ncbi:cytochrome c5 family protein [Pleionea sp. CnH1-48]|uniref:c-type cytochrome n=1 Tax=Pleionea sp. CnH1-48 TaxID=2954494 RepID=UPI002097E99B|nr:c-type cytochrome [Pleionea sp. CnH1-48]MCO7227496.1 c-type cytochrome [Pleionea sp. CnH1-48]
MKKHNLLITIAFILSSIAANSADDYTKELFELYCQSCHSTKASGAPQAFDHEIWQQRIKEKGIKTLVENSIKGIGNMPPLGMCMECGEEDFQHLIRYMAKKP